MYNYLQSFRSPEQSNYLRGLMNKMSASASKRKRKELDEQGLSPKTLAEKQAKEKKSKTMKNVLIVALVILVAAAAVFGVVSLVNAPSYDTSAAVATVGSEKVTVPVYDCFYNLNASNFYNNYSFLIQTGTPLSKQNSFFGNGTMEDYLIESTNTSLQEILNVVAKARENNFQLSDEQKTSIKEALAGVETEAKTYGFTSADKYLRARFGEGCTLSSYEDYLNLYMLFSGYAAKLSEDFQPSAEDLKAAYEKDPGAYDLVNFTYIAVNAESSPVESEEKPEGDNTDATASTAESTPKATMYTDEAKEAAKKQADAYIEEMPPTATTVSYNKSTTSSYLSEEIGTWLFDEARKEGDAKVFARNEENTAYFTVRFNSRDNNDYHRVNANIISIAKDTAEVKEGEQSAQQKRDALLEAVKEGMSDEDFAEAVTKLSYSSSTTSVTKSYTVEEIRDYLFDESRKAGDLKSFETDTAYYVARYVSTEEDSYRDTLVKNALWSEFYSGIAEANKIEVNEDLLKHANTDLTFNANTSES